MTDINALDALAGKTPEPKIEVKPEPKEVKNKEVEIEEVEVKETKEEVKQRKANEAKLLELQIQEKQLALADIQDRIDERALKVENKISKAKAQGNTLKSNAQAKEQHRSRCNHKKGGNGLDGIKGGKGDAPVYAILKHVFANGDMWIRCLRCGKTWKPPIRESHKSQEAYDLALSRYETAMEFTTTNTPSGSIPMQFSDGGKYFRKIMEPVNLD